MDSIYTLLRDTPDMKAGARLSWNVEWELYSKMDQDMEQRHNGIVKIMGYFKEVVECNPDWFRIEPKLYTEKELLDAEEKAFKAGREYRDKVSGTIVFANGSSVSPFRQFKYINFNRYKNNTI